MAAARTVVTMIKEEIGVSPWESRNVISEIPWQCLPRTCTNISAIDNYLGAWQNQGLFIAITIYRDCLHVRHGKTMHVRVIHLNDRTKYREKTGRSLQATLNPWESIGANMQ